MTQPARIAIAAVFGVLGATLLDPADAAAQARTNTCVTCHASLSEAALSAPPKDIAGDVHDKAGVRCADCHGGNPAAADRALAHDVARGYRVKPSGAVICASCHALFAEKFATSVHAPIMERGCVECHGNHGVKTPTEAMLGTSSDAICLTCHSEKDDAGFIAAERMRKSVDRLGHAIEASSEFIASVRNGGMEVGDQELALSQAWTNLRLARMEVHAFTPRTLDAVVDEAMKIVTSVNEHGNRAIAELAYRRRGLFVSLGAILLMVVALALKIRDLDQRH